jgi:hypothetical protein
MIFLLPLELLDLTFTFLDPSELKRLFQLDEFIECTPTLKCGEFAQPYDSAYRVIRHLALKNYYRHLVMSSFTAVGNFQIHELQYLIKNQIVIHPKDISFVVASDGVDFVRKFCVYSKWLNLYSKEINLELVFAGEEEVNLVNEVFEALIRSGCEINKLKVKRVLVMGTQVRLIEDEELEDLIELADPQDLQDSSAANLQNNQDSLTQIPIDGFDNLVVLNETSNSHEFHTSSYNFRIQVKYLQLHLFDSSAIINHLKLNSSCFLCDNLATLNLSYNTLNDLSQIKFPSTLVELNLSNNYLLSLSSLKWTDLTNLKVLNLANNNLMSIDLSDRRVTREEENSFPYSLAHLNLSGNNLLELNLNCKLFTELEDIDLSRNCLTQLSKFPAKLLKINLTGNYISSFFEQLNGEIFPKNLDELNISFCKIDYNKCNAQELVAKLLKLEKLEKLRVLRLSGCHRDNCLSKEIPSMEILI